MKLAIISHTLHYKNSNEELVGWGPTITEINHLLSIFGEIYHVAVLSDERAPDSAIPYSSSRIHFIPLKKVGGTSLKNKFDILFQIPDVLYKVQSTLKKVDYFQLRTPTAMGVYLIPYLSLFPNIKGWYKYAGNWKEKNAAPGFALQRWMLKNQYRKVTINGTWANQKSQCISFENPCLTNDNRIEGKGIVEKKELNEKINFCFVGTFYKRKGIDTILKALEGFKSAKIGTFYFVGGGNNRGLYEESAKTLSIKTKFIGFLSKEKINEVYKKCHFIVLPSENEGFPKVIGEAMNYGCVPVISAVSCIDQYIVDRKNGYLISPNNSDKLKTIFKACMELKNEDFDNMINYNYTLAEKFTYEFYSKQLKSKILEIE